ncbi:MAG: response regulator [Candidatus Omnitrophica bacterium]|nr:response regulator [Candidatus Omnitrophota bacterium]
MAKTVMIVDDEEIIIRALLRVFRDEGYNILTATNPKEALDTVSSNHIDLIISDKRMPDMDGVELLQKVAEVYPDSIRLILSGSLGFEGRTSLHWAIKEGIVHEVIHKPWENEDLKVRIRDYLEPPANP